MNIVNKNIAFGASTGKFSLQHPEKILKQYEEVAKRYPGSELTYVYLPKPAGAPQNITPILIYARGITQAADNTFKKTGEFVYKICRGEHFFATHDSIEFDNPAKRFFNTMLFDMLNKKSK